MNICYCALHKLCYYKNDHSQRLKTLWHCSPHPTVCNPLGIDDGKCFKRETRIHALNSPVSIGAPAMWVTLSTVFVVFNVATLAMFLPVSAYNNNNHNITENHSRRPAAEHDLSVYFIFLPPVSSIVVPRTTNNHNGTIDYMFIGLDGYVLHILCERLHRRAVIHTNTDPETLEKVYFGYAQFERIRHFHRQVLFAMNEISVMSSR